MTNKRPIRRVSKFYSEEDFELDIYMGREAVEGDGSFEIILYRVDRESTQYDDIYYEASAHDLSFLSPVSLFVVPLLEEAQNKTYNPTNMRYLEDGNLKFGIYSQQLEQLGVDIKVGDYIGYQIDEEDMVYFTVTNSGEKNYDYKHTILGYKSAFRTVECTIANPDEFNAI